MALFESSNPTLSEKIFRKSIDQSYGGDVMTVRGSVQKFGFLMLLVLAGAAYTWKLYYSFKVPTMLGFLFFGLIGGLVCVFAISFKPNWAKYLSPVYALLEGFVLGGLSAFINDQMKVKYPNIIIEAVGLTFGVAFAVFLLYNARIIRATAKFRAVILSSMVGIMIFYVINMLLGFFGVHIPFMQWGDNSLIGIAVNLFVVVIAALSLVLNFDQIETGEKMGAPKYMEWYGAFGLLVTIVWLYLEILKLLSRFSNNRS
ncbi:Bax inhibitor-1/YccA family protein [Puia dinghuensis]|uniref:Membrane protein n=1 Tax=Puia dinghuensis TaxID=1792502 RepID=A0A8J2XSZ3_9BACT|nr:Bax inhibitor-1/YccA family protein [Puia dinghuensis]GGB13292.1 membrane protein [Puia dinghuensis]